jgi:methylisocitrate lyase
MGFAGVGYPLMGIYSAARAMEKAFAHLLKNGNSLAIADRMMQFDEFTRVVGLDEKYRLDEKYSARGGNLS